MLVFFSSRYIISFFGYRLNHIAVNINLDCYVKLIISSLSYVSNDITRFVHSIWFSIEGNNEFLNELIFFFFSPAENYLVLCYRVLTYRLDCMPLSSFMFYYVPAHPTTKIFVTGPSKCWQTNCTTRIKRLKWLRWKLWMKQSIIK